MKIAEFVENFKTARIQNSKVNPNAVSEYMAKELVIKKYIPFREKRQIAEMIVEQYTEEVNGIKKHDSIGAYVGFVAAMISAHTALEFSADPVTDYDLLSESGLLPQIVSEFQESYNECDIVLKMALAMELEDNNVNVLVGHFLNRILGMLDGVSEALKDKLEKLDLKDIFGADIKQEDLAKLNSLLDKLK